MRFLYSLLLYLLTPYLLVRLWWKGRRLSAYRQNIAERFCLDKFPPITVEVWLHAVSLGEVIAATPLIEALLQQKQRVLITCMTPTGRERAKAQFGERVIVRYLPYDLPWVLHRFFSKVKPKLALIMETELWPNLLVHAKKAQIPIFLLNARLSEHSFKGYKRFDFFFKPLISHFQCIFTQSEEDATRFRALGADPKKVQMLGNMKFDLRIQELDNASFRAIKKLLGEDRLILLLASTHGDEEQQVLSRLNALQERLPSLLLLIAPRHPERFQEVYQSSINLGFKTGLRSKSASLTPDNEVVILDSLGELPGFYSIADYAFVGGSLVPVGGHNVLEPIALGIPVFSGSHVHNFKTICRDLLEAKAIVLVNTADELIEEVISLHQNPSKKHQQITNASRVLHENKGAIARYMASIEELLG
ncbi:MAG: lipid IV(A) 3-deoxy-D-manno-octulosonic acid transferase [Tatlockia sp.]